MSTNLENLSLTPNKDRPSITSQQSNSKGVGAKKYSKTVVKLNYCQFFKVYLRNVLFLFSLR